MNFYYFSALNVNLLTVVMLFPIWLPSEVSWSLSFVADHRYGRLMRPTFRITNRLVPKVFFKIGPTASVVTSLSDLYVQYKMLMKKS